MPFHAKRPHRLLVTGGRGRLASLIADHFYAPEYATVLHSRESGAGLQPLDTLLQPGQLQAEDTLLHLAWSTLPATSEKSPGMEQTHDLPWLERLLSALIEQPQAHRPHLVFFSSGGAVYGNAPGRPNREDDACHPLGNYARAKLAAEQRILQVAAETGLAATILRISNPYGYPVPGGRPQGIIPHAIRAAVEQRPLSLWGDGHACKDFLYYTDFLAALHHIIGQRLEGVFNVCSGRSHRISEVITRVEHHTHRRIETQSQPAPAWDVQDSRLDPAKLIAATGWQPQVDLDEGIRRSVAGYVEH